jgi:hypothetical protein
MTPSHRIVDISMRANAWEGIGKELKIKRKFYVSSRDVRIVCPRQLQLSASVQSVCNVVPTAADLQTARSSGYDMNC